MQVEEYVTDLSIVRTPLYLDVSKTVIFEMEEEAALERKMQRHKHVHQPAIPQSFDETERLLQEFPEYW